MPEPFAMNVLRASAEQSDEPGVNLLSVFSVYGAESLTR